MVHKLPSSAGLVTIEFNTRRVAALIVNMSVIDTLTITPHGGGGITITLPPGGKIRIPDKIGLSIQGANSQRDFAVLEWAAGDAE